MELIGLFLGLVSGLLLAYPILGYPKQNKRSLRQSQLRQLREFMIKMDAMTDSWPESETRPSYKTDEKKKFHDKFDPQVKDLEKEIEELGPGHERLAFGLSSIGMAFFVLGFGVQAAAIALKPEMGFELASRSIGPFADGSAVEPAAIIDSAACRLRRDLRDSGVTAILVVGRFDWRPVRTGTQAEFSDNARLAQGRADRAAHLFRETAHCETAPIPSIAAAIGGPRIGSSTEPGIRQASSDLSSDRSVDVYGFRIARVTKRR